MGCSITETDEELPENPGTARGVPDSPSNLSAVSGDARIDLTWDSVSEAESYTVYRATSTGSATQGSTLVTGLTETEYIDQSVENGTTYYYQVTGVADEEGPPSDEIEVTPFSGPPSRP